MPMPWSWVPPEWSDPYGGGAPDVPTVQVPTPPPDPNVIDYGSPSDSQSGIYYDEKLGMVDSRTGQPVYPNSEAVQNTIRDTVQIAKTLGHPDAPVPEQDPSKERLIAQVAGPRSDVARITATPGAVGTIGQIGKPVPGMPPLLDAPQPLTPPLLGMEPPQPAQQSGLNADAVSGAGERPPTGSVMMHGGDMPTDRPIEEIQDPVEQARAWADYAKRDPEGYADAMRRHQLAELERRRPREEQIMRDEWESEKAARTQLDAIRARAVALQDQIEKDSTALARQHITDRRSFGQKAAHFISAVVSGLVQGKVGGRNIGLDQMNADIDRDIEVQKQEIANAGAAINRKQGLVAQLYAQHGDLERASETARRATKEHALQQLEMEMAKYDPQGSMARQLGQQIIQGRAQLAQANQKWAEHQIDRDIQAGEYGLKVRADDRAERKFQADEQRAAAKAAMAGAKVPKLEDIPLTREQLRTMFPDAEIPEGMPPMTMKQAKAFAETGRSFKELTKSGEDVKKITRENSPEERARQFGSGKIVDDRGKPVEFRDPGTGSKMAKLHSSSEIAVGAIDRILAKRDEVGWESDIVAGPALREMKSDFSKLLLELKNTEEMGVLAGPDKGMLEDYAGTKDPTEWRDPRAGLLRLRQNIIDKRNTVIGGEATLPEGRSLAIWNPKRTRPPAKTPSDVAFQNALRFTPTAVLPEALEMTPQRLEKEQRALEDLRANQGMTPSVRDSIERLGRVSHDPKKPEKERLDAQSKLEQLARDAESEAVRSYAVSVQFGAGAEETE